MDKKHSPSRNNQIAFGGLFSCLSLAVMLISPLFPMTLFSFPAVSGLLLLIVAIETTVLLALTGYIAVSLLSFLLLTKLESTILFALFFGYYPTVSYYIENKFSKPFRIIIKLFLINTCFLLFFYFLKNRFDFAPNASLFSSLPFLLITANIITLCYDYAVLQTVTLYSQYRRYLRPRP